LLVPSLLTKLKRCQVGLDSTQPAFDELTKSCIKRKLPVEAWRSSELFAMEERGDELKIFDVNRKKPPTLAEITLQLTDMEDDSVKIINWIADGIKAENDQWVFIMIFY
jgi:hypothetical protein